MPFALFRTFRSFQIVAARLTFSRSVHLLILTHRPFFNLFLFDLQQVPYVIIVAASIILLVDSITSAYMNKAYAISVAAISMATGIAAIILSHSMKDKWPSFGIVSLFDFKSSVFFVKKGSSPPSQVSPLR